MIEVRRRHERRGELQQTVRGLDAVLTAPSPPRRRRSTKCRNGALRLAPASRRPVPPLPEVCGYEFLGELDHRGHVSDLELFPPGVRR
jgi:hypothetical protein